MARNRQNLHEIARGLESTEGYRPGVVSLHHTRFKTSATCTTLN